MPFKSKAQQGLFFSNPKLKKYAKKWAHETGMGGGTKKSKRIYANLPEHVKRGKKKRKKSRR
jgi:hypothetical protein